MDVRLQVLGTDARRVGKGCNARNGHDITLNGRTARPRRGHAAREVQAVPLLRQRGGDGARGGHRAARHGRLSSASMEEVYTPTKPSGGGGGGGGGSCAASGAIARGLPLLLLPSVKRVCRVWGPINAALGGVRGSSRRHLVHDLLAHWLRSCWSCRAESIRPRRPRPPGPPPPAGAAAAQSVREKSKCTRVSRRETTPRATQCRVVDFAPAGAAAACRRRRSPG